MILREEHDESFGQVPFDDGSTRRRRKPDVIKRTIYDGDIDPVATMGDCRAETCADGGFKLVIHQEDEFGFESHTEIILTKFDVEELKKQGFI